jgi:hypothetical protein
VLTQRLLGELTYELALLGFGDHLGSVSGTPNMNTGYMGNPYRTVSLGGSPAREKVPFQRIRQAAAASLHWILPTGWRLVPYLAFRPSYRFYWDDWGLLSHAAEVRGFLPIGPVELRLTGRYYTQNQASFANEIEGKPQYLNNQGKVCSSCALAASRSTFFYTSDPKLYQFDAFFVEARLLIKLAGLARFRRLPLHQWLAGGVIELSYGHYFNSRIASAAFGDADLAGLSLGFPL